MVRGSHSLVKSGEGPKGKGVLIAPRQRARSVNHLQEEGEESGQLETDPLSA